MVKFTVKQISPQVTIVEMPDMKSGDEQWFLLSSDRHLDHKDSDLKMQKRHLDEALERGAGILDHGDLFCAMQSKQDRRADPKALREEFHGKDYFDAIVDYNAKFIAPYAENFVLMSPGNHEQGPRKHIGSNLTQRLSEKLELLSGKQIPVGTYAGFVLFRFRINGTKVFTVPYYYTHGYGGGGPVNKGMQITNRQGAYIEGTRINFSGHIHESWQASHMKCGVSGFGKPYMYECLFLCCPGYKDEASSMEGWHTETGKTGKPKGAWWIRFSVNARHPEDGVPWDPIQYEAVTAR